MNPTQRDGARGSGHGAAPGIAIAVIGAGPRGTITLERLCANAPLLAPGVPIDVHVIDPYPPGGGRVWESTQPRGLLMNTVASDVTVFTDPTVPCDGPIVPGPTQYQWAREVAAGRHPAEDDATHAEAAAMLPWSYASRAFQGRYLAWAFDHVTACAPGRVRVHVHEARATALGEDADGMQHLELDGGAGHIACDAVVLAQGHFDVAPTEGEARLAEFARVHDLVYVPPASPAEVSLRRIPAGAPVIVRGLGLNFFDYMALLTEGRGGRFVRDSRSGGLRYEPSGREPVLHAGSGRGVPHQARPEIHLEIVPRYRPRFLTPEVIARLRARGGDTDFRRDLWPYVAKEVGLVYYSALLADRPASVRRRFETEYPQLDWDSADMRTLLDDLVPDASSRWSWDEADRPAAAREFADREDFARWIVERLDDDVRHALLGPDASARKAAAAVLRDLRDEIRQVVSHRGLGGGSYRAHVDGWFSGLVNHLASGPPAVRVEQLAALVRAGVVRPLGPRMRVAAADGDGLFTAWSDHVPGEPVRATALIEARLPLTDIRRATDPLLAGLLADGGCRPHVIPDRRPSADRDAGEDAGAPYGDYETGGLDVTEGTLRVIDRDGAPHPARYAYGPPIESVQWVTAIGARPHVASRTLLQADSIARSCLELGVQRASSPVRTPVSAVS